MNPYNFVPYPAKVRYGAPHYRDTFAGNSGVITCELEALSPFLVMDPDFRASSKQNNAGRFMHVKSQDGTIPDDSEMVYLIPGTSLKGMVRSVAEVLSDSCVVTGSGKSRHLVPDYMQQCKSTKKLCTACRIFGYLNRGDVLHGNVNIGQAKSVGTPTYQKVQLVPMAGPNPRHEAFYGDSKNPAGRKFYYHQNTLSTASSENDRERGPWVELLDPGATFTFTVTYENLSDADLSVLVASLALTDGVRHKLGYGKPAGCGSVEVRISRVETDGGDRYTSFSSSSTVLESGSELDAWVKKHQQAFFQSPSAPVKALADILRYPQKEGVVYQYPTRDWFNKNSRVPLSQTP